MEPGVAPAVVSRKHAPGRLGSPSVPTTRGCLEWLGGARNEGGESRPGYERVDPFRSEPWKHGPEVERRHGGAPGGERASQSARRLRKVPDVTQRLSALRSLMGVREERGRRPPRRTNNGDDESRLFAS